MAKKKRRKSRRKKKSSLKLQLKPETLYSVLAIVLMAMGVLIMLSFSGQGELLQLLNSYLIQKLGLGMLFLPFVFIASGLVLLNNKWAFSKPHILLGSIILMLSVTGLLKQGEIGLETFQNLSELLSITGAYVFFGAGLLVGIIVLMQLSLTDVLQFIVKPLLSREPKVKLADEEAVTGLPEKKKGFSLKLPFAKSPGFKVNDTQEEELVDEEASKSKTAVEQKAKESDTKEENKDKDLSMATTESTPAVWEFPPLSLLSKSSGGEADRGDVKTNAQTIESTLDSFGIKANVREVNYGPAVTQYALEITRGTKLSRITNLSTDLALALAAPTGQVRIEAPIAGRSLVGIEVPNHSAQYVTLRTMLASKAMKQVKSKLAVALGLNVAGQPVIADIGKMPHVLIAGATGSGKSVAINSFMCSILFRASPQEVRFILVDPKRVELTGYNDIPHLLTPVIVDPPKVVSALKWACNEMEQRYKKLAEVGVKNIDDYNELAGFAAMPSIVIVIDELADIMLFAPSEVEDSITRIAQMARAVGIHLVLSTQRPSVDVITGLIKANVPSRIAFNVSSMTDSRVVLDQPGAEKLLGRGDMLFIPPTQSKPFRIQGTYVSDNEARQLIQFLKSQGQKPDYKDEITTKFKPGTVKGGSAGVGAADDKDDLFDQAVKLIAQYDKASSSLIQRRLSVGYARAARILDQLYEAGFVSPPEGSKPREVFNQKVAEYMSQPERVE